MAIQNGRSNTSGNLPVSIPNDGQIFVQQADGILLTRKPDGTVRQTLMPKRAGIPDTAYTVKRWDTYVGVSTLTAPHAILLPAASAYPAGQPLVIADESGNCSTANQITITPNGSDTINGAVSLPQTSANFGAMLFSDGASKWTAAQFSGSAGLTAAVVAAQAAQTAAQTAQTAAESAVASLGQCRLEFSSTTQLNLNRRNGRLLFINGGAKQIPAGGVPLPNTGLTQATVYYVFAYMSGSVMALEASTTGYAIDPTYGIPIKSGDPTRTLVGIIYTDTGTPGVFADTPAKRYVASWFNPPTRSLYGAIATGNTASTTAVEFNTAGRVGFVSFAGSIADGTAEGSMYSTTTGASTYAQIGLDGVAIGASEVGGQQTGNQTTRNAFVVRGTNIVSDGFHYLTPMARTDQGTATFSAAISGRTH